MKDIVRLKELFERLGAPNPAEWAQSQIDEELPQLARFLFLRQAWRLVVDDDRWVDELLSSAVAGTAGPGQAAQAALGRTLAQGANIEDLTRIVRYMQWRLLAGMCYLLDDPGSLEEDVRDVAWRLFQVNDKEEPIALLASLHESVLETEPRRRHEGKDRDA